MSETLTLITIHNNKFIEALIECGNEFDLYATDHHLAFQKIGAYFSLSAEQNQIIETNNLYTNNSNFLFPCGKVSPKWAGELLGLHEKGFLNFPPIANSNLSLLLALKGLDSAVPRQGLSQYPVLLPTLNKIQCGSISAKRHFHPKTPQHARYVEAILACMNDPEALKSIHEVYASLIYVDEAINHFHEVLNPQLQSDSGDRVFAELLAKVRLELDMQDMGDREVNEILQMSEINMIMNWLFNVSHLNKTQRIEFLRVLSLGENNPAEVRQYMHRNNLFISIRCENDF